MDEYISIKDFANRAGVTLQEIYQRLDKDLKSLFKEVTDKKILNIKALKLFCFKEIEQDVDKQLTSSLQETLKLLILQLEVKDNQISELNARLKEAQELNKNNQVLLGTEQNRSNQALFIDDNVSQEQKNLLQKKFWQFWRK